MTPPPDARASHPATPTGLTLLEKLDMVSWNLTREAAARIRELEESLAKANSAIRGACKSYQAVSVENDRLLTREAAAEIRRHQWQLLDTAPANTTLEVCQSMGPAAFYATWFASVDENGLVYREPGHMPSSTIPTHWRLPTLVPRMPDDAP